MSIFGLETDRVKKQQRKQDVKKKVDEMLAQENNKEQDNVIQLDNESVVQSAK